MKKVEFLLRIRENLHDPEGKIWNDDELVKMLENAACSYSEDTGIYRGVFSFVVDSSGACKLPLNFLSFVAGWGSNGNHINPIPVNELQRFYGNFTLAEGDPEFCYEDFSDIGKMRLCPNPYIKQNVKRFLPSGPGIISLTNYGVPVIGSGYGLPVSMYKFKKIGDAVYIREEEFEKIHDYMALIYHVVYQAHTVDSDLHNGSKADLFFLQYKKRIARFGQLKATASSIKNGSKYY